MKEVLIGMFILFSVQLFGQKSKAENVLEMNTKFILELQTKDSIEYTYKIISKEPFVQDLEWSIPRNSLDSISVENHIQGILTRFKIGDKTNSILLIQSGLDRSIRYKLKIKTPENRSLIETSVIDLRTNVPSVELWPSMVEYIQFYDFISAPEFEEFVFESTIDSTCVKNRALNKAYGNELFIKHSSLTINEFKDDSPFELNKLLLFEDSLNTEDVSLGHYWGLGKGIYPNNNKFSFGNPISRRRLECPFFEGTVNFFYTKKGKSIKVVSYGWNEFKGNDFSIFESSNSEAQDNAFSEKYDFVLTEISKLLGEPVSNVVEEDGRRLTKWRSKDDINACLFNFSNYNEIRLYIYKE